MADLIVQNDLINSQNKVFFYKQSLKSDEFNRVFSKTLPTGIYEGGSFQYINENTFYINPFSIVIEDRNNRDIAVRIRIIQQLLATITPSLDYPLVIARFTWEEGIESYLQILQVSETEGTNTLELNPKDIILGKLNLVDIGGVVTIRPQPYSFDYTRKNISLISAEKEVLQDHLFVRAPKSSEAQNKVYVEGGFVRLSSGVKEIIGGLYPSSGISNTAGTSRTDYIYIDTDGSVKVDEGGSSGVSNPYYGRKVIAEIRREAGRNSIRGSEIFNIANAPIGAQNASTFLISNSQAYYTGTNVTIETALRQVWEKAIRQVFEESDYKIFRNIDGTRFERDSTRDSIILRGGSSGTLGRNVTITTSALSENRTLTLANADTTLASGTMVSIEESQAITGAKTFRNAGGVRIERDSGKDAFVLNPRDTGTLSRALTITTSHVLTANRTLTLPDANVDILEGIQVTSSNVDQNVDGIKTFIKTPVVPVNTTISNGVVPKSYVDSVNSNVTNHISSNITSLNAVHGILQGSGNGFDADTVDGAHISTTTTLGNSDALLPTQKAVKTYADGINSSLSGHVSTTTSVHGSTSEAIANRLMIRDSGGRSKIVAPIVELDIANKGYVDAVDTTLSSHTSSVITNENSVHGIMQGSGNGFDADRLDGEEGTDFHNSTKLTGIIPAARLSGTYSISISGQSTGCSGLSATATKLNTARTLNGKLFDGSSDVNNIPAQTAATSSANEHFITFVSSAAGGHRDVFVNEKVKVIPSTGYIEAEGYSITSSRTKKDDIKEYENSGLEIIDSLKIVTYIYKNDENKQKHIGIIAEDSHPDILTKDLNTLSVADSIGVLFKAVQELSARVKELENR